MGVKKSPKSKTVKRPVNLRGAAAVFTSERDIGVRRQKTYRRKNDGLTCKQTTVTYYPREKYYITVCQMDDKAGHKVPVNNRKARSPTKSRDKVRPNSTFDTDDFYEAALKRNLWKEKKQ